MSPKLLQATLDKLQLLMPPRNETLKEYIAVDSKIVKSQHFLFIKNSEHVDHILAAMPPPWNQFEGFYWLSRDSGESHVGVSNFERNCWMADSSWAWICLRLAFLISRSTSSFSPRFISSFFLSRNLFEALRFCSFLRSRGSVGSCESEDRRLFGLGNLSLSPAGN